MPFIILLRFQNTNLWYSVKCSLNEKTSVKRREAPYFELYHSIAIMLRYFLSMFIFWRAFIENGY